MALPKRYRLSDKLAIEEVFKKGRIINSRTLFIRFKFNHLGFSRFTVAVGLKISKKAAIRNKIRRRLNEIIRLDILKIKLGYDFVISAKPKILDHNYDELKILLMDEFSKIK